MFSKYYVKGLVFGFVLGVFVYLFFYFWYITEDKMSITFVNVGQGDSALITLPNKTNILYDTGKENFGIENIEKALNKSLLESESIDYLILSHSDLDHIGKAKYFIDNYLYKNNSYSKSIFLNNIVYFKDKDIYNNLLNIDNKSTFYEVFAGQELRFKNVFSKDNNSTDKSKSDVGDKNNNDVVLSFINPVKDSLYLDENEGSVATLINRGKINFIMMADIGVKTEKDLIKYGTFDKIIKKSCTECINILKVGHHGSQTSSSEEFLKYITPDYCVVSVGENSYGHPHKDIMERLNKYCKKVYRTDLYGNINFEIYKDNNIQINVENII